MAFKHLLVPTDFSEPANGALRYAIEEAALHGARVTLLHVLPTDSHTDVHYLSGDSAPGPRGSFDLMAGGRVVGRPLRSEPEAVRRDHTDEALTRLKDLIANAFRGRGTPMSSWGTRPRRSSASPGSVVWISS
jgi:nucleotide-binding universal stress UspA family protein